MPKSDVTGTQWVCDGCEKQNMTPKGRTPTGWIEGTYTVEPDGSPTQVPFVVCTPAHFKMAFDREEAFRKDQSR